MSIIDEYDQYDTYKSNESSKSDPKLEEDLATTFLMTDLFYQKLNLEHIINNIKIQFIDLYKHLNYVDRENNLEEDESKKEIILFNYQDKVSLLRSLSWKTLNELILEVEWEKIKCFDIYVDAIDRYIEVEDDLCDESQEESKEKLDESEEDQPQHIIYIVPSYQTINDWMIDYDPKNMEYETYIHEIKEITIGNQKYRFL